MAVNKIDRKEKLVMRQHLERFVELQREMDRLIENCAQEIEEDEYRNFLEEVKNRSQETTRMLTSYMVRKCNR